jgi:hypothetical protein
MPWAPELFTAPVAVHLLERERIPTVRFFDGLRTGDLTAIIDSFAGVPELHDPLRGRVKGVAAFERFVADTNRWLDEQRAEVEEVALTYAPPYRGIEEVVLHLDGGVDLPVAIVDDRTEDDRIVEMRVYFRTGRRTLRAPLLQPDPGLEVPAAVGDHLEQMFPTSSGIVLEPCSLTDDGRACALEYNVVARGAPPQAGVAVFVRGENGRLAAARKYDDVSTL